MREMKVECYIEEVSAWEGVRADHLAWDAGEVGNKEDANRDEIRTKSETARHSSTVWSEARVAD